LSSPTIACGTLRNIQSMRTARVRGSQYAYADPVWHFHGR
jgi:hypothetical protein